MTPLEDTGGPHFKWEVEWRGGNDAGGVSGGGGGWGGGGGGGGEGGSPLLPGTLSAVKPNISE